MNAAPHGGRFLKLPPAFSSDSGSAIINVLAVVSSKELSVVPSPNVASLFDASSPVSSSEVASSPVSSTSLRVSSISSRFSSSNVSMWRVSTSSSDVASSFVGVVKSFVDVVDSKSSSVVDSSPCLFFR